MDLGLAGAVFVVTGGSRGLGLAGAQALVDEGARVVVCARDPQRLGEVVAMLGERALGLPGDLSDPALPQRLVDAAVERFGRLDGALVSVGGPVRGGALEVADEQWRDAFESVFLGVVRLCRAVVPALPAGGGALALVLSTTVRAPMPGLATSNALRPGLAMLAKTMADELGPQGVRVNGLLPGSVETDRLRELDDGDARVRAEREATIPLRRYGRPEELGRVAAFLLSPAASYLTGAMVPVDGGATRAL